MYIQISIVSDIVSDSSDSTLVTVLLGNKIFGRLEKKKLVNKSVLNFTVSYLFYQQI